MGSPDSGWMPRSAPSEDELRQIVAESHRRLLREVLMLTHRHLIASVEPTAELAGAATTVGRVLVDGAVQHADEHAGDSATLK